MDGSSTQSTLVSSRAASQDARKEYNYNDDLESGYASATSSTPALPSISFTSYHLNHLNAQLEKLHPRDILRLVRILFPNLYQSTALGLTGLVTLDILSKLQKEDTTLKQAPVEVIFLDTLYHFQETYDLLDAVRARYPQNTFHIFKPEGADTAAEFESQHGKDLFVGNAELYDWMAKVEPLQRAYAELNVAAVLTGRRRSQGGQRNQIPIIEVDEETGVIKINPFVNWSFKQVKQYIDENQVPYNALLDRGYKSIGDWHSTTPVAEGEDERAGRWKGQDKTECGIHNKKSRYALYLEEMERKRQEEEIAAAFASQNSQDATPLAVV